MTKKMHKIFKTGSLAVIALIILAGCYPRDSEYYSDLDLTVTDYDTEYSFGEQKTYWMADTVEYKTNIDDSELDPDAVRKLLQQIESNFASRGYDRLNPTDTITIPDFVITVSVIGLENSGVGWIPSYPCYWGCYYPYYYPYYPPYWGGYYYSYSYTTGTVITNWWDPQIASVPTEPGEAQPVHWMGIFNGLLSSSKADMATRISGSVDQAFKQSPYIQSNN